MVKKLTESISSAGKKGVRPTTTEEPKVNIFPSPSFTSRALLPDEVNALARKVFLKFDFILVLPILIMFCQYQYEYL